jgi:hypothetical protein
VSPDEVITSVEKAGAAFSESCLQEKASTESRRRANFFI